MTAYSIAINSAAAVSMQSLGMAFAGLELASLNHDVASLKWTRRRASVACPLAHNDVVEIYRGSTRLFRGRARLGTLTNEGCSIRILGPWSYFEEQIFQLSLESGNMGMPDGLVLGDTYSVTYSPFTLSGAQSSPHTVTFTVTTRSRYTGWPATTGESDVNMGWASRCWLFKPQGSVYTTIQDEWDRLSTFISTVNADAFFTAGTLELGGDLGPRTRTVSDITVAEAVRQVLAMKPDAALWWDYSASGLPILNLRVASLETAQTVAIGTRDGMALTGYQLKVADDLVPTGVVIRWERDASTSSGLGTPYLADFFPGCIVLTDCDYTSGSANVSCDSTEGLEVGMTVSATSSVNLASAPIVTHIDSATVFRVSPSATSTQSGLKLVARSASGAASHQSGVLLHTVTDEMPWVPGLAKEIYTSLSTRRAQGSLTILDRDFSLGLRPGMVITLTGDPQLANVQLWVQSVAWSPDTGLAQLTVGYPAHLQLRDRADLKGWLRRSFTGPLGEVTSWVVPPP